MISSSEARSATLRVVHSNDRCPEAASGAMKREGGIDQETVGAEKIWLGYVELGPGLVSAVHHHGEPESGIYIISAHARFCSGERLDEPQDARAGDFVWVP